MAASVGGMVSRATAQFLGTDHPLRHHHATSVYVLVSTVREGPAVVDTWPSLIHSRSRRTGTWARRARYAGRLPRCICTPTPERSGGCPTILRLTGGRGHDRQVA